MSLSQLSDEADSIMEVTVVSYRPQFHAQVAHQPGFLLLLLLLVSILGTILFL